MAFFRWMASAVLQDDLDWVDITHTYPFSIFVDGDIRVEKSPQETKDYLRGRQRDLHNAGAQSMSIDVVEIGENKNGRFPVMVRQSFRDHFGQELEYSLCRFL